MVPSSKSLASLNLSTVSERTLSEWMSSVRSELESSPPTTPILSQEAFSGAAAPVMGEGEDVCFGRKTGKLVGQVLKVQLKGHGVDQKRVRLDSGFFEAGVAK